MRISISSHCKPRPLLYHHHNKCLHVCYAQARPCTNRTLQHLANEMHRNAFVSFKGKGPRDIHMCRPQKRIAEECSVPGMSRMQESQAVQQAQSLVGTLPPVSLTHSTSSQQIIAKYEHSKMMIQNSEAMTQAFILSSLNTYFFSQISMETMSKPCATTSRNVTSITFRKQSMRTRHRTTKPPNHKPSHPQDINTHGHPHIKKIGTLLHNSIRP